MVFNVLFENVGNGDLTNPVVCGIIYSIVPNTPLY